jgi:hypothetical protein
MDLFRLEARPSDLPVYQGDQEQADLKVGLYVETKPGLAIEAN